MWWLFIATARVSPDLIHTDCADGLPLRGSGPHPMNDGCSPRADHAPQWPSLVNLCAGMRLVEHAETFRFRSGSPSPHVRAESLEDPMTNRRKRRDESGPVKILWDQREPSPRYLSCLPAGIAAAGTMAADGPTNRLHTGALRISVSLNRRCLGWWMSSRSYDAERRARTSLSSGNGSVICL
jgi:hypothetical protein